MMILILILNLLLMKDEVYLGMFRQIESIQVRLESMWHESKMFIISMAWE